MGLILLSLSTYAAYTERYIVPLLVIGVFVIFRKKIFANKSRKYLKRGLAVALLSQIPHFYLLFTPAFFPKQNLFGLSTISGQAAKISRFLPLSVSSILAFSREFLSQYFTYFSPRSLFFLPDPDSQRSIPELSVFYFWMIVPFMIGAYSLWKQRRTRFSKFIFLLALIAPIPAALTRDPFSTHRAMPHFLPLMVIIGVGISEIINKLSKKVWVPLFSLLTFFSLLLLWRSYIVFLPQERAKIWGYGFKQLTNYMILKPDVNFIVDQARIKPSYIQHAFFLRYPPEEFQKRVSGDIKDDYYSVSDFNSHYKFANLETRSIDWPNDVYEDLVLVGDEFAISEGQAKEHSLTKVYEIRDPIDQIVFQGYRTNPTQKCLNIDYRDSHCKGI
jgi:hypothetical protein